MAWQDFLRSLLRRLIIQVAIRFSSRVRFEYERMQERQKRRDECTAILKPIFELVEMEVAELKIAKPKSKIPTWELENPYLLLLLGYIAGMFDAQLYRAGIVGDKQTEHLIDNHFLASIWRYLQWIPGAAEYVQVHRSALEKGSSPIRALQGQKEFMRGMQLGGDELLNMITSRKSRHVLITELGL